jgi:pSer/pThr/pTyr-binding forkhead associated (FHA) protein
VELPSSVLRQAVTVLSGVDGPAREGRFVVEKSIFQIGADQDNDLIIEDDDQVSGSHAWLCYSEGSYILVDQSSRNGTWLNGKRVGAEGAKVRLGDHILIGRSTFEIQVYESPECS